MYNYPLYTSNRPGFWSLLICMCLGFSLHSERHCHGLSDHLQLTLLLNTRDPSSILKPKEKALILARIKTKKQFQIQSHEILGTQEV